MSQSRVEEHQPGKRSVSNPKTHHSYTIPTLMLLSVVHKHFLVEGAPYTVGSSQSSDNSLYVHVCSLSSYNVTELCM